MQPALYRIVYMAGYLYTACVYIYCVYIFPKIEILYLPIYYVFSCVLKFDACVCFLLSIWLKGGQVLRCGCVWNFASAIVFCVILQKAHIDPQQ